MTAPSTVSWPDGPTLNYSEDTGQSTVDWPDGRPEYFAIESGVFEYLVREINALRAMLGPR